MTKAERRKLLGGLVETVNATLDVVRLAQCAKCLVERFEVLARHDDGREETIDLMKGAK